MFFGVGAKKEYMDALRRAVTSNVSGGSRPELDLEMFFGEDAKQELIDSQRRAVTSNISGGRSR